MALLPANFDARFIEPFVYLVCSVIGCGKERYAKTSTLCKKHYGYNLKHGELKRTRFEPNEIEFASGCALIHLYDRNGDVVAKAIVDSEDVDKVSKFRWMLSATGYVVNAKRERFTML